MDQHHPSTLAELLDTLEHILSPEALADLRDIGGGDAIKELNYGSLGLYIKNKLIDQNNNRIALYEDCHREYPRLVDLLHSEANDVSQLVIIRLWERLRGICGDSSKINYLKQDSCHLFQTK